MSRSVFRLLGFIAAVITIFVFLTGKVSIPHILDPEVETERDEPDTHILATENLAADTILDNYHAQYHSNFYDPATNLSVGIDRCSSGFEDHRICLFITFPNGTKREVRSPNSGDSWFFQSRGHIMQVVFHKGNSLSDLSFLVLSHEAAGLEVQRADEDEDIVENNGWGYWPYFVVAALIIIIFSLSNRFLMP